MRLWKKITELLVTKSLTIGKNAVLIFKNGAVDVPLNFGTEVLAAAKTILKSELGKTFYLASAGGFTVTLPPPVAGGTLHFVVSVAPTTAYILVTNASANILIGGINELEVDTADDGPYHATADTLNFVASIAVVGDYVDLRSDGTSWFVSGQTNADGGVTFAST